MIRPWIMPAMAMLFWLCTPETVLAEDFLADSFEVDAEFDVTYGEAVIGISGTTPHSRELKMDVFRPASADGLLTGRPAVILAFGGAFHRGSKGTTTFEEDGASDSSMGDYCRVLAASGYVCMSIEYRLVTEDPAPPEGTDPSILFPESTLADPAATARVDLVRKRMGLAPLDDGSRKQLWNTILASTDDLARAVDFAQTNADRFGLDPDKIAIGGFSAGAVTAINAAYGRGSPVKAVISLSGGLIGYDLRASVTPEMPKGLFILGQDDLPGMQFGTRNVVAILNGAGIEAETAWIAGFGHFYPMGATSLGSDFNKMTLKRRILEFLDHVFADES